ncbi:MAG: hypothetical protein ACRCUY_02570 [Thermoguttaceae bacterium]
MKLEKVKIVFIIGIVLTFWYTVCWCVAGPTNRASIIKSIIKMSGVSVRDRTYFLLLVAVQNEQYQFFPSMPR